MKIYNLKLILIIVSFGAFAQTKKEKDLASIKAICGCFEVNFNFACAPVPFYNSFEDVYHMVEILKALLS